MLCWIENMCMSARVVFDHCKINIFSGSRFDWDDVEMHVMLLVAIVIDVDLFRALSWRSIFMSPVINSSRKTTSMYSLIVSLCHAAIPVAQ